MTRRKTGGDVHSRSEISCPPASKVSTGTVHAVPIACLVVFAVVRAILAYSPLFRADWWLENLLTFAAVPLLVATYRRYRFSDRAYVQGTVFLILHTIGSHYTYSHVPFGDWLRDALHLGRNHYDRVVHFAFGLLLLAATRELLFGLRRASATRPRVQLFSTVGAMALWSVAYELVEWLTAIVVDPAAGTAFLGTQGDPWDCQKDMTCALVGALLAVPIEAYAVRAARAADKYTLKNAFVRKKADQGFVKRPPAAVDGPNVPLRESGEDVFGGDARTRNPAGSRLVASITSLMSSCSIHAGARRCCGSSQKDSISVRSGAYSKSSAILPRRESIILPMGDSASMGTAARPIASPSSRKARRRRAGARKSGARR
jgi:putative membrane protein